MFGFLKSTAATLLSLIGLSGSTMPSLVLPFMAMTEAGKPRMRPPRSKAGSVARDRRHAAKRRAVTRAKRLGQVKHG